ncbi:hypothetical protein [Aquimarina algiphila]|uniref:hypothetical protein n=1 Tax=Aquimarina algiphila TaxID=2047982 RepID=UPI00248F609C|nr:hypothetical protein [Aquimarina algiphila]
MKRIKKLHGAKVISKKDQSTIIGNGLVICLVFCPTYCVCIGDRCEYRDGRNCSAL